jgi:hypothetical protein
VKTLAAALAPFAAAGVIAAVASPAAALDRPDLTYKVFQFPKDKIPRIDGDASDWDMVTGDYVIGSDQLIDAAKGLPKPDPKSLDARVRVGWVKGENRLYVLYEAYDDNWQTQDRGLQQDIFELVVDGDASGGPFVAQGSRGGPIWTPEMVGVERAKKDPRISDDEGRYAFQGAHAQNYHIFTPAVDKDWTMAWSAATWVKDFPFANHAAVGRPEHGKSGKYTLEFYITPFDYAGAEGPERAVESLLYENKIIGLGWAIIDREPGQGGGFWALATKRTMYGDASLLRGFRLMPLEPSMAPKGVDAQWSFKVVDMDRRLVAFKDESTGGATSWKWDLGDGTTSTEQHPQHAYAKPGEYVITLEATGPAGTSRLTKVWNVSLR